LKIEEVIMRKRVVVTGLGCISPLGNDLQSTWNAAKAGVSGTGLITHFDSTGYKTRIAAEVKGFDGPTILGAREARRLDRFSQFAIVAAQEAVQDARLVIDDSNRDRIGVVIGSAIGGLATLYENTQTLLERGPSRISPFMVPMMLVDTGPGMVALHLQVRGPNMAIVTACATGTNAIGEATEMVRRGQADVILTGGSEAAIVPIAVAGMSVMNAVSSCNEEPERASRPFDLQRDGFVMGEGAAVLVIESLEHALARGAPIQAEIIGYGATNDAYHITAPAENGAGAARCMQAALDNALLTARQIDYINAHGTSTPLNDKSETLAIKTVFRDYAYKVPISSTKSMTGHLLGASGAVEAAISIKSMQEGLIPPTVNYHTPDPECDLDYVPNHARPAAIRTVMSNSFGFGGHNGTIILSRYEPDPLPG
jgi:3-oxoacyl-[acyl-carrier-protein] synthase II